LSHQAEQLDSQLADWQERYPNVGMTTSIETADDWVTRVSAGSSLMVRAAGTNPSVVSPSGGSCATAVVPG
jgi:hypothetical protein